MNYLERKDACDDLQTAQILEAKQNEKFLNSFSKQINSVKSSVAALLLSAGIIISGANIACKENYKMPKNNADKSKKQRKKTDCNFLSEEEKKMGTITMYSEDGKKIVFGPPSYLKLNNQECCEDKRVAPEEKKDCLTRVEKNIKAAKGALEYLKKMNEQKRKKIERMFR